MGDPGSEDHGGHQPHPQKTASLAGRDVLSLNEFTTEEISLLLSLARRIKAQPALFRHVLAGRTLAMIFEKPSLRTRVTFEIGMNQLGGETVYLGPQEIGLGRREAVKDVGRNLSRWVDVIMARVFTHRTLTELAEHASVPVINGLSDFEHPCQALGDYLTLVEHKGRLEGLTLVWIGDGNNVAHSLIYGAAKLGVRIRVATPPGYEPSPEVVSAARAQGGVVELLNDPRAAVAGADAVYTDVWTSMGQEAEASVRAQLFAAYQVNAELMRCAGAAALFMHCLPADRGQEVTDDVIDSQNSLVYDQAENRLHAQKAVLLAVLSEEAVRAAAVSL